MNKPNIFKLIPWAVFVILAIFIFFNFQLIEDTIKSMSYTPTPEMQEIQTKLNLTKTGERIFKASSPVLSEADEFNVECQSTNEEISTLGCFNGEKIFIYNITEKKFEGIRESTTAHELLHAYWARFSENEKNELTPILENFAENADKKFKDSLETYQTSQRLEEIFVRSGTQVRDLPDELEEIFENVFIDQDAIVNFYDSYSTPFDEINKELKNLSAEMSSLNEQITNETAEYEEYSRILSGEIDEYNNCVTTYGCFPSRESADARRLELEAKQSYSETLYEALSNDIDRYNQLVETYNKKVVYGRKLDTIINSNKQPEELE